MENIQGEGKSREEVPRWNKEKKKKMNVSGGFFRHKMNIFHVERLAEILLLFKSFFPFFFGLTPHFSLRAMLIITFLSVKIRFSHQNYRKS